jgi:hypothetical protein
MRSARKETIRQFSACCIGVSVRELFTRFVTDLLGRIDGPMKFRLVLQPIMAMLFAIRDGRRDFRQQRPPYFWSLFRGLESRSDLLRDGWRGISRVFALAFILDVVYQFIELHALYLTQSLAVAIILAVIPYVLLRGPANRLMSLIAKRKKSAAAHHAAPPRA